jgi:hypothetical protein
VAYNGVVNPLFHANPEAVDLMQTASSLKSAYSRAQVLNLPPIPVDAIDIAIPPEYANIQIGHEEDVVPFLMFNYSYASVVGGQKDSTILAFGTDALFTKLCNARTVYMDGTFSICPPQFYQVFSIHFFPYDSRRQIPAIYCLLTGKTENIYTRFFGHIIAKALAIGLIIRWEKSMADFESGLWPALHATFPLLLRKGCLFHFMNAVFKWIKQRILVR